MGVSNISSADQQVSTPVNIVVAHVLEAKALISMLRLESEKTESRYPQYGNSNGLQLIVSGIGREAIAKAVKFLAEQQANDDDQVRGWINIGIAGHRDAALGSGWLGNKITEISSGSSAYPSQLINGIPACRVITVDEPESIYPEDAVYEMEASAFFDEASRQSTAELVQLFKIISDNLENPITGLDLKNVPKWIAKRELEITTLVVKLSELVGSHNRSQATPPMFRDFCRRNHVTVNQKLQLKRLCQRYRALGRESDLYAPMASAEGAKQLISVLTSNIDKATNPVS